MKYFDKRYALAGLFFSIFLLAIIFIVGIFTIGIEESSKMLLGLCLPFLVTGFCFGGFIGGILDDE